MNVFLGVFNALGNYREIIWWIITVYCYLEET